MAGYSDPSSVLDARFQVRGVDRLRVVDMSVWPSIPGESCESLVVVCSDGSSRVLCDDTNVCFGGKGCGSDHI